MGFAAAGIAGEHRASRHHRDARSRLHANRNHWNMDKQSDVLRLRLVEQRSADLWRKRLNLRDPSRLCGDHDQRQGHGDQRYGRAKRGQRSCGTYHCNNNAVSRSNA